MIASAGRSDVHVFWEGSQFVIHSFALINREQCWNLARSGAVRLTLVGREPDQFDPSVDPRFSALQALDLRTKGLPARETREGRNLWVTNYWPPEPKKMPPRVQWAAMSVWEYSLVPKRFLTALSGAAEVWTPSAFSRNAFVRSGFNPARIHVVPNGIRAETYHPGKRVEGLLPTAKPFRFLFVGGTIPRKGVDILLQAYAAAFSPRDPVTLVIKELGNSSLYQGQTGAVALRECRQRPGLPEMVYLDASRQWNDGQMADLYRSCDVFVSSYRGEGFSLPTLEAMACGLPVIVTAGGPTDEFVDESVGWRIPSVRRPFGRGIMGWECDGEASLLEPDVGQLAQLLREAFESEKRARKGEAGASRAHSEWTWNHATVRLCQRVDALFPGRIAERAGEVLFASSMDPVSLPRPSQGPAIIRRIKEWILEHPHGGHVEDILPARRFSCPAPGFLDEVCGRQEVFPPEMNLSEKYLACLRNPFIAGKDGLLVLPDGSFAREAVWGSKQLRERATYQHWDASRAVFQPGRFYSLFFIFGSEFYHWFVNVLLRLHAILERLPGDLRFLLPARPSQFQKESLRLLGIPEERLVPYDGSVPWRLEELWFSPNISGKDGVCPLAVSWFNNRILTQMKIAGGPPLRLYLSREGTRGRRVANEADLAPMLARFGFQRLVGHQIDFSEQIRLFSRAEAVVGSHGGALTNILYARPGTRVLELQGQADVREHFFSLASAAGHIYHAISGPRRRNLWQQYDVDIDPEEFSEALERMFE